MMVMKDKLVKTNHKGPYYLMKKLSVAFLAVACLSFAIAIPTYIIQSNKAKKIAMHAEEESSEVVDNNSEESETYEGYND